jgi:DNA adenine methylase
MKHKYHSPLRYPGGKGKLLVFVKDLILHNGLENGSYSEPYAGGASVALGLLMEGYVSEIYINDIDKGIYSFWYSILNHTDDFLRKLWDTPVSVEEWKKQVSIYKDTKNHSTFDLGFSTFFLNRTNRSGVINAGIIGGLDQTGNYKIDARYKKDELTKRIVSIYYHKDYINLSCQDAIDFISKTIPSHKKKGLIFLDPPYYVKGRKLYTSFYKHEDHQKVADAIKNSPHQHWIVTYDNSEKINEIYDLKNKIVYNIRYSINHQNSKGSELLFYSESIQLPYHPNDAFHN